MDIFAVCGCGFYCHMKCSSCSFYSRAASIKGRLLIPVLRYTFWHFFANQSQIAVKIRSNPLGYCNHSLGSRSKQPYFTIFRNIVKIIDWIGYGIFLILAIATVKESWEAYLNSATSWTIERHPIQHQPTFKLVFGLSAKICCWNLRLGSDFNITFMANSKR